MQHASNLLLFTSHTRFIPRSSFSYKPLRAVYQQEDWYGYQEFDQRGEAAAGRVDSASVIVRERSDRIDLTRKACPEPSRRVIPSTFAGLSVNSARNLGEIAQPVPSTAEGAAPRDDTGCRMSRSVHALTMTSTSQHSLRNKKRLARPFFKGREALNLPRGSHLIGCRRATDDPPLQAFC
jgi:hypothetical protein